MKEEGETRQERRERRLQKKRKRIPQHGKSLARVYRDAVLKRLRKKAEYVDLILPQQADRLPFQLL